jgi:hypothetical protein
VVVELPVTEMGNMTLVSLISIKSAASPRHTIEQMPKVVDVDGAAGMARKLSRAAVAVEVAGSWTHGDAAEAGDAQPATMRS